MFSDDQPAAPTLSIIIPAYNYAHLLPRALDSIFSQWQPGVEVLVIDDGSTDDTTTVLASYHQQHSTHLQWLSQDNAGVAAARNRGINMATGSHLWLLDADDELADGAVAKVLEVLEQKAPTLLLGSHCNVFADGREKASQRKPISDNLQYNFLAYLQKKIPMLHGAFVVKKEELQRYPYPSSLSHSEDIPVFAWLLANLPALTMDAVMVRIHKHAGSRRHDSEAAIATGSTLVDVLFDAEKLPPPCMPYRDWYLAFRIASVFRTCYLAGDYNEAKRLYRQLLGLNLRLALRWRTLSKRLRMLFR